MTGSVESQEAGQIFRLETLDANTFVVDAPNWTGDPNQSTLRLGLAKSNRFLGHAGRGQLFALGQLYGLVGPGLIMARHVFEGLRRDMRVQGDGDAAASKLAITWAAKRDATIQYTRDGLRLDWLPAPKERVFVVYTSPNRMLEAFPSIHGWIEHWAWLGADPELAGAPIEWETRYDRKLWSAPRP